MEEEWEWERGPVGLRLRTVVGTLGRRAPLIAAVAAVAHVVINAAAGHVDIQAPARDVTLLVATVESPLGAGIRAGLVAAVLLTVAVVVVQVVERDLFGAVQTPELALEVGLVGVVVEEPCAPKG